MYKRLVKGFAFFVVAATLVGIFYYMAYLRNSGGQIKGTLVNTFQMKVDETII